MPRSGGDGKVPRLWVVGEEDEPGGGGGSDDQYDIFDAYNVPRPDVEPVSRDAVPKTEGPRSTTRPLEESPNASSHDLIVFVDPLDGTREYIENRIHNVQCLIGITRNGIPIAGAVGLPFGSGRESDDDDVIEVVYGWVAPEKNVDGADPARRKWKVMCSGVKQFDATNVMPLRHATDDDNAGLLSCLDAGDDDDDDDTLVVLSGDSKKPALQMTMDCLEHQVLGDASTSKEESNDDRRIHDKHNVTSYRKIISGGCGNKILYLGRRFQMLTAKKRRSRDENDDADSEPPPIVGTMAISPPGSSSWDTAAPTAVLLSMDPNALITDLVGRPLIYDGRQLTNVFGVVVSCGEGAVKVHKELCGRLAKNEEFCQVIGINTMDALS